MAARILEQQSAGDATIEQWSWYTNYVQFTLDQTGTYTKRGHESSHDTPQTSVWHAYCESETNMCK